LRGQLAGDSPWREHPIAFEGVIRLQGVKCDAISDGRVAEIGPNVTGRHCDARAEPMRCGESFNRGGGHAAPLTPVTMLKQCHRPGELPHRKHLDLVGQFGDLRAKSVLNVSRQSGDRFRELGGHLGVGKGGAKAKEP